MTCNMLRTFLVILLLFAAAGCPGTKTVNTSPRSDGKNVTGEPSADDLLRSAIHQLRPENYTIAAAPDKPVNLLNSWHSMVGMEDAGASLEVPAGWINDANAARVKLQNYDLRDAVHVRDAMLTHTISAYVIARGGDEIANVQGLVEYVVRNVALRGSDEPDMPLGVYHLLLIGRGSVEDRAWVLAALLRQIRIDSVIIRPSGDAGTDREAWLFGAILNGRVYLYDLRLGIAIPSSADLTKSSHPATLDDITAHPEWLSPLGLRSDQPYAIEADSLQDATIRPIVEPEYWSDRMKRLESVLPADDVCVLYDPVADDSGRTGLLTRLTKSTPKWNIEQLKPWDYPEQQFKAMQSISPSIMQAMEAAMMPFKLPIPVSVDEKEQKYVVGNPEERLLKIRTDQLQGKFDEATKRYLGIRHLAIEEMPIPNLAALNQVGAEYAIYWTGVCKFEMGDYESAIEQLSTYLKRHDRNGRWNFAARALLAECHAKLGNFQEAMATVERTRSDDPYRAANAIRVKLWSARSPE